MITARGGLTALRGCAAPPLSRRAASRGCVPCAAVAAPRVLSAPPWWGRVRARWRFSASGRACGRALPASASASRGMRRGAAPSRSGFRPRPRGPAGRWPRPAVARGFAGPCPSAPPPRGPLRLSAPPRRPSLGGLAARCPPPLPCAAAAAPGASVPRAVSLAGPCPAGRCGPPCGGGRPLGRSGRGLCARWAGWRPSRAAPRFGPAGCGPPLRRFAPCPRSSRAGAFAGLRPALSRARASAFWGWGSLGLRASDFRLRRKCHPPPAPPIREGRRRTPAAST